MDFDTWWEQLEIFIGEGTMCAAEQAWDYQQYEIDEYRKALQKVIDDSYIGVVPKSHLNHIEELLKKGE